MEDEFDCVKEVGRFWKLSPNVRPPYLGEKERVLNKKKKRNTGNFRTTTGLNVAHEDTALLMTMIIALTRKYVKGRGFYVKHVKSTGSERFPFFGNGFAHIFAQLSM